ncbi:hypothetical protein Scep_005427 [Stephania cephalantha]|uniref:Uncharacterized protein n=1 Tax=Stephania cephalantha TaxID=152367 RepID=A0AAP0KVQ8_9MAGN
MLIFQTMENHMGTVLRLWRVGNNGWEAILVPSEDGKGWGAFLNDLHKEEEIRLPPPPPPPPIPLPISIGQAIMHAPSSMINEPRMMEMHQGEESSIETVRISISQGVDLNTNSIVAMSGCGGERVSFEKWETLWRIGERFGGLIKVDKQTRELNIMGGAWLFVKGNPSTFFSAKILVLCWGQLVVLDISCPGNDLPKEEEDNVEGTRLEVDQRRQEMVLAKGVEADKIAYRNIVVLEKNVEVIEKVGLTNQERETISAVHVPHTDHLFRTAQRRIMIMKKEKHRYSGGRAVQMNHDCGKGKTILFDSLDLTSLNELTNLGPEMGGMTLVGSPLNRQGVEEGNDPGNDGHETMLEAHQRGTVLICFEVQTVGGL